MQLITAPIHQGNSGDTVKNLHYSLFLIKLNIANDVIDNLYADQQFKKGYVAEVNTSSYGPATVQLVMAFQTAMGVVLTPNEPAGGVDISTMVAINRLLNQFNGLNVGVPNGFNDYINSSEGNDSDLFKVSGYVYNTRNEKISGQLLLAYDVDLRGARLYRTAKTLTEFGTNGGVQFLSMTISGNDGYYEMSFPRSFFQLNEFSPTDLADVIVFAFQFNLSPLQQFPDDNNPIVGRSALSVKSNYTGNQLLNWDVQLENESIRGETEFSRITKVVFPFVTASKMDIKDLKDWPDQLNFLATETGQDIFNITQLSNAGALYFDSLETFLNQQQFIIKNPLELFYGIGRQNIVLSWPSLLSKSQNELKDALDKSVGQNIISTLDDKLIIGFITIIKSLASEFSATVPETAVLYRTIGLSVKEPQMQKTFVKMYMQFAGSPAHFWSNLGKQEEFTPAMIQSLQLTNQLSILTGQHTDLIEELQVNRAIKDPSDLLSITPDEWVVLIRKTGIPSSVQGNTDEEKINNYRISMQNLLHTVYPTQKIALMVKDKNNPLQINNASVQQGVVAFFATARDFDISTSRIGDFAKTIDDVVEKNDNLHSQVLQQLKLIQRIYQVSPTPDVMGVLIKKGYTSAYHISSKSQMAFIASEANDLGGKGIALSVYNRAQHQVMRAQHILLKIGDTQDKTVPSKVITEKQQQAISNYLNTLNS